MAVDMFLVLQDISGETQDEVFAGENAIDVLAWSWGATQQGTKHMGGGGGSGKANFQDISLTKYVDSSSTALLQYLTRGDHIPEGRLVVRKAGGEQHTYIEISLTNTIITSISTGGSGGEDRLTENITLNFAEFEYQYNEQMEDGTVEEGTPFAYNIATNTETG